MSLVCNNEIIWKKIIMKKDKCELGIMSEKGQRLFDKIGIHIIVIYSF